MIAQDVANITWSYATLGRGRRSDNTTGRSRVDIAAAPGRGVPEGGGGGENTWAALDAAVVREARRQGRPSLFTTDNTFSLLNLRF